MASNKKGISGTLPEFGAIFMCNLKTKEECFNRKLFGLPLAASCFVENVKAGMLLFLFEFQNRMLYGVFEAVSDGGVNIVPYAYRSSGKSFPAQVQFRIIWRCVPLRERDFRDAIRENYYAANKFNFGLSKSQVHRLLFLFDSRRVKVLKSLGGKKVKTWPSKPRDDQNLSFDPGKPSAQNFDYPFSSEPNLSADAEESSSRHPKASTINSCITAPSASEDLSLSGDQPAELLRETEIVGVSSTASFELGDFIPLSSPDSSELVEIEISVEQSNLEGSSSVPTGPCDFGASLTKETEFVDVSSSTSLDLGHFIPLVSPDNSKYKLFSGDYPSVKGLYSDAPNKRASVFSRLKLNPECAALENKETKKRQRFVEDESVELIMENLLQRQQSWMEKTGKETRNRVRKGENSRRASVFSRLSFKSEVSKQEKEVSSLFDVTSKASYTAAVNSVLDELVDVYVKEMSREKSGHGECHEDLGHTKTSCLPIQVEILDNAYGAADNSNDMAHWRKMEEAKPLLKNETEGKIQESENREDEGQRVLS